MLPLTIGAYPTPVERLTAPERAADLPSGVELWCKRDDQTSPLYGGNKVRKLEHLLREAYERGAKRIVTIGGVGSHHVLASTLFGTRAGFEVEAVLAPQPWSQHVEDVARVNTSLGLRPFPVSSYAAVPVAVARRLRSGSRGYFVPPGGSSVTGSLGYVEAATELAQQIARGEIPRPSAIVVALGSGGTVAGLLVGLAREGLLGAPAFDGVEAAASMSPGANSTGIEVIAVQVVEPPIASGAATLALALGILRRLGDKFDRRTVSSLSRALHVTRGYLGRGYGHPTAAAESACEIARAHGLEVETTYTAKAFAAALDVARTKPPGTCVLYWHTLAASAPFQTLLAAAVPTDAIDPRVRVLMRNAPVRAGA